MDASPSQENSTIGNKSEVPCGGGSGSGFIVSGDGHILTNAHVVDSCASISVDGQPAFVFNTSEQFDLAISIVTENRKYSVASFSLAPARLNSGITAAGYPFAGILGGLNMTRGTVSALKGIGGSVTEMQITAPVQPGNSGGPLVGPDGDVVGVVIGKLNALRVEGAVGDIPNNVNFAIQVEIAAKRERQRSG